MTTDTGSRHANEVARSGTFGEMKRAVLAAILATAAWSIFVLPASGASALALVPHLSAAGL